MRIVTKTVFSKETGNAGNYRIPAVVKTKHGTIIACADERFFTAGDNPNRIDKVIRRSKDYGASFEKQITVVTENGYSKDRSSAAIDPCLIYDDESDTVFLFYCHTPSGVGILNSKRGTGYNDCGEKIISRGRKKLIFKNGGLFLNGKKVYDADENGAVFDENGKEIGNYCIGSGGFSEHKTSYLYMTKSTDDGVSWEKPVCLNYMLKEKYMAFIGPGPGVGVKLKNGKYANRLVVPIYFTPRTFPLMECSAAIYSDDGGLTWKRGAAHNDARRYFCGIKVGHRFISGSKRTSESQLIELPDGTLRAFIRNHDSLREVAVADSRDGGATWENFRFIGLPQCVCQMSAINIADGNKEATVFLNGADKLSRRNGVIRLSYDYGETFPYSKTITEGDFVYSSICEGKPGSLFILYEGSLKHESIEATTLRIEDIKEES